VQVELLQQQQQQRTGQQVSEWMDVLAWCV
jgi:hypothetical protein